MKRLNTLKVFLLFFFFNLLVHLPFMNLPPSGSHVWRQCNTLAMSRNFAKESMNILEPRIDRRNETNGITGSHFPLYEWVLAAIAGNSPYFETVARYFSLFISSLILLGFYLLLIIKAVPKNYATVSSLLLLSVPQIYYDSINAMPDILALCFSVFALYQLIVFYQKDQIIYALTAFILCLLAGMIKFQFLIIPASSIVFIKLNRRQIFVTSGLLIFTVLPVMCWYRYALDLIALNNLKEYGLWIKPLGWSEIFRTISVNLISDLPELLTGWPLFTGLIIFGIRRLKNMHFTKSTAMYLIWLTGFAFFYAIAIERMQHHSYYFMALIPLPVILITRSLIYEKNGFRILLLICFLNYLWAFARVIPSRWTGDKRGIPAEFADKKSRLSITASIPAGAKTIIGPDISGCIYFYFTGSKGYSFASPEELIEMKADKTLIEIARENGCRYLLVYSNEELKSVLLKIGNKKLLKREGNIEIWYLD